MYEIEIEKGVALDARQKPDKYAAIKDALHKLVVAEIGDSILIKDMRRELLYARRADWGLPTGVFSMRIADGGVRVWKVAEPKP